MERKNRIARIYGYAVCLVSVVTFLIAGANLFSPLFDLTDPLHAPLYGGPGPSLASFETYKLEVIKQAPKNHVPDDETLRAMYAAAREERIQIVRHRALNQLTASILSLLTAVFLFSFHWIWLRRLDREKPSHPPQS